MRAWDVVWGSIRGSAVIQNSYVDVSDVVITSGESRIRTAGRFSIGYPRSDGGEEIDARVEITRRPMADLRHAFTLDEYDLDGTFSGEFHVNGNYLTPSGLGSMEITDGVAYGEPFESATAGVRLEGEGVRLENIQVSKGGGRGTGAAFVGWNGTYSFNFDARDIPVESLAAAKKSPRPVAGLLDFTAGGSGTFDSPRYDVRATVRDLFVADEGIGQIVGNLSVDNNLMTVRLEAASPRLAVSAIRPDRPHARARCGTVDQRQRHVTGSRTCARSSRSCRRTRRPSRVARFASSASSPTSITCSWTPRSSGSTSGSSITRSATPGPYAWRWIATSIRVTDMRIVGQDTQLDVSGAGQPPRFAHCHPCNRRCQPCRASGIRRRRAELRHGGAGGHDRGAARGSCPERDARHHRRAHQALRAAACAREHQRRAAVRYARRDARRLDRHVSRAAT